ncbi:MAG: pseudouridine-5'-phosphate glycosidase [SAR324 cluster bacterium]|nr:pseudouridine-5'-phosphate glycosidase [SAR324 cluster bacterium]MED5516022.1 pseudouridine-5'-phosphate glycosidase [SAR324 cluster bacterium]MEE2599889.1 pseudouridine-5'-phosphate glycosidase [SAR324 cluster bacterium]
MDISTEVQQALKTGLPIVALESTIISHGMPFPQNLKTALKVEKIIREESAVPATIAILNGRIKIGLSQHELEQFAKQTSQIKVSRRDLPLVISQKQSGGTTVAATMICAKLAGIAVFVTGGIGGVHRESENTMDISADLMELAQTNVAVVCAGIKSILDIPRTLEYLETQGVPVIGYKTEEFPAFYTPSSGSLVQSRLDTPEEIAHCMKIKWKLGLDGGIVIGNPVQEQDAMDASIIQQAISEALRDAAQKQIEGKNVTPFLLERINRLTMGKSLKSNISLVCNNAHLGAKIAVAYQTQR